MIRITINTARYKITVEGHALAEEHPDHSAICTGVSAIVQGLVYSISKFNSRETALKTFKYRDEPGNMLLKIVPEQWAELSLTKRFNYYGDGLELMARSHPESIEMIWDGERILPDKEDEK